MTVVIVTTGTVCVFIIVTMTTKVPCVCSGWRAGWHFTCDRWLKMKSLTVFVKMLLPTHSRCDFVTWALLFFLLFCFFSFFPFFCKLDSTYFYLLDSHFTSWQITKIKRVKKYFFKNLIMLFPNFKDNTWNETGLLDYPDPHDMVSVSTRCCCIFQNLSKESPLPAPLHGSEGRWENMLFVYVIWEN